jgi:hypothetical protein
MLYCSVLAHCLLLVVPQAWAEDIAPAVPDYNLAVSQIKADIGSFGAALKGNFDARGQILPDFVPIEARVGRFFMSALSDVSRAVYSGLLPFLNILVAVLFGFWILMETWQMMRSDKPDAWDLAMRIVKRGAVIVVWMWILNNDPADIFMWLMAPVISIGTAAAGLIMDAAVKIVGVSLPDTCAAIHSWLDGGADIILGGQYAADLLCVPTRAAAYFYTFVLAGTHWMGQGLGPGGSGLTFLMGIVFVCLFVYNIWKFALSALGVVADLFFVLLFMPFTAVKECFAGDTKYDGIFRPVWDRMAGLISGASLSAQFTKFIGAVIYFIVLAIVSAICVILLAGVGPMEGGGLMDILITGCLVAYLMGKIDELAGKLGGKIDASFGDSIGGAIKSAAKGLVDAGKKVAKLFAKKK